MKHKSLSRLEVAVQRVADNRDSKPVRIAGCKAQLMGAACMRCENYFCGAAFCTVWSGI